MSRFCVSSDFNPFVQSRWKERAKKAENEAKKRRKKAKKRPPSQETNMTTVADSVEDAKWLIFDHISKVHRTDGDTARKLDAAWATLIAALERL